jgi:hypothetical protein
MADLDYTDPGHEATAVLRIGDRARRNEPHPDLCSRSDPSSRAGVISRHVACFSPALTYSDQIKILSDNKVLMGLAREFRPRLSRRSRDCCKHGSGIGR